MPSFLFVQPISLLKERHTRRPEMEEDREGDVAINLFRPGRVDGGRGRGRCRADVPMALVPGGVERGRERETKNKK